MFKRRGLRRGEFALFLAPLLVLVLVGLVSRLKTIELPRSQLIQSGKPLLTVVPDVTPDGSLTFYHAVRLPNGTYKIYWVERPPVVIVK